MIFVTVGTHEQQFDRLVREIDRLKGEGAITDEVVIQKGYSEYCPKNCQSYKMLPYEEMEKYQKDARIIITHGGPASFIYPISIGKKPIVVPRQKKYNEHVNDHQLEFCQECYKRGLPIVVVSEIEELEKILIEYGQTSKSLEENFVSNNDNFNDLLIDEVKKVFNS